MLSQVYQLLLVFRPLPDAEALVCFMACWAPPSPLMSKQAGLFESGVTLEKPLGAILLQDLASTMPGTANSRFQELPALFNFI